MVEPIIASVLKIRPTRLGRCISLHREAKTGHSLLRCTNRRVPILQSTTKAQTMQMIRIAFPTSMSITISSGYELYRQRLRITLTDLEFDYVDLPAHRVTIVAPQPPASSGAS
jgi:hypothetical protein